MRKYVIAFSVFFAFGLVLIAGAKCNFLLYADSTAMGAEVGHIINVVGKIGVAFVAASMCGFSGMIILGMRK